MSRAALLCIMRLTVDAAATRCLRAGVSDQADPLDRAQVTNTHVINPSLLRTPSDAVKDFAALIQGDLARYEKLIRDANISLE